MTQQRLKIWHDNDHYYDNYELIEWYKDYQKRKVQKAKIKEGALTYCVASLSCGGLVYVRRPEKRDRKIVEVTDNLF